MRLARCVAVALVPSLWLACTVDPDFDQTHYRCGAGGRCPTGYNCDGATNTCQSDGDPGALFASCQSILDDNDAIDDGVYTITPPGSETSLAVFCDMTTAGGGWMLIARTTVDLASDDFGWMVARGDVNDDAGAYSLGPVPGLAPTELLVGNHANGKKWGAYVYQLALPTGFPGDYGETTALVEVSSLTTNCPGAQPQMLRTIGHTTDNQKYFFRDNATNENYGLFPAGWALNGPGCDYSGMLDQTQGMIMAR